MSGRSRAMAPLFVSQKGSLCGLFQRGSIATNYTRPVAEFSSTAFCT